jgi:ABC-2 type transport system permease protein
MIRRIARKELTEMIRDGRFRVLAAAVLGVSVLSLAVGWKQYADISRQHQVAQAATRSQWLHQTTKNPHSAAHYGVYAFKPKSPLAIVDTGVDPYMGVAVWLEAHKQNEFKYRPAADRTAVERFGEMTAAETLQVLVPLFIVLMTFSAFAGEREQGTLRQLLSLGVKPRDLALGKAAGVGAALGLILLPAALLGVAALALTSDGGFLSGSVWRTILLVLFYLAYFATFVAISLGVSARARSSRLALVLLLAFWFANSLIASRVAADVASWLHPTPSAVEFQKAMEADLNQPQEMERRLALRTAELMRQYRVDSPEALPIAMQGVSLQEGENHGDEVFDAHYGRLFDTFERQNTVYQVGGLAAPMLAIRSVSMGLAGTDFNQHRHFITAAEAYRRLIQRTMNDDIMAHPVKGGGTADAERRGPYVAGSELWAKVPPFEYEAPATSWVLANTRWSIAMLAVWLILASVWMSRPIATRAI